MQKLSDLARRPDFRAGPLLISPARRRIEGPSGEAQVEPLIMQVFLLLIDARGEVVTRNQLFDQVWGGAMVGDDSLNRAVARVRRIDAEVGPGLFGIETIPRTGYRLIGEMLSSTGMDGNSAGTRHVPRRAVIAGGFAAAVAGGLGLWWVESRKDQRFNELMARGEQALSYNDPSASPADFFRPAVAMRPDDARAQGKFAYALALLAGGARDPGNALQEADGAIRAALAIDPDEPSAHLASTVIQQSTLDFAATEDRLRKILRSAPANTDAMRQYWNMLQCVGRSGEALALVERATKVDPLGAGNHYPRAQLLWILGRTAEADRVIDQAMRYWPEHRFVRFAQFTIFAFTERPRAALAMLESKETAPQGFTPAAIALWRVSLAALEQRTPASIAAARTANLDAAKQNLRLTSQAVLALSALGEVDAAFEVANALFVVPGESVPPVPAAARREPARSTAWRFAPWLFTPPTASLRADPRFKPLCDAVGLTDYWARRNVKPDYQREIV